MMKMVKTEIFKAANNDGTGREDYHVMVEGAAHTACYGAFRTRREAEKVAAEKRGQSYWDTGDGEY